MAINLRVYISNDGRDGPQNHGSFDPYGTRYIFHTVDGAEIRRENHLRLVVFPMIYQGF